ncbi:Protein tyrosine kinase Protein kinase domain [Trypanosoma vivax]|nr:putative protein kinase [Trypanosoma vivax]KAH8614206.1 Protein tyrosine kinase Protein kinase domain [Trypanosoma vivax]
MSLIENRCGVAAGLVRSNARSLHKLARDETVSARNDVVGELSKCGDCVAVDLEDAARGGGGANKLSKGNVRVPQSKPSQKTTQTKVTVGMRLNRWIIMDRIGAGSFGETFTAVEVDGESENASSEHGDFSEKDFTHVAGREVCIKVEQDNKNVLRIEAAALKRVQMCPQVVRYMGSGSVDGTNFIVMQKLGPNLAELRRSMPSSTFSVHTALHLGVSCLKAIRGIHELGLVHRDIKPSNFVIGTGGQSDPRTCYLIDFGLARRYRRANGEVRPPRENAGFRGTSRYASIASHHQKELGRVDDIWSLLFMLIEFVTGTLPWRKFKEKEDIGRSKEESIGPELVHSLPREFASFLEHLCQLKYEDEPKYDVLLSLMEQAVKRRGYPPDRRLDWETKEESTSCVEHCHSVNASSTPYSRSKQHVEERASAKKYSQNLAPFKNTPPPTIPLDTLPPPVMCGGIHRSSSVIRPIPHTSRDENLSERRHEKIAREDIKHKIMLGGALSSTNVQQDGASEVGGVRLAPLPYFETGTATNQEARNDTEARSAKRRKVAKHAANASNRYLVKDSKPSELPSEFSSREGRFYNRPRSHHNDRQMMSPTSQSDGGHQHGDMARSTTSQQERLGRRGEQVAQANVPPIDKVVGLDEVVTGFEQDKEERKGKERTSCTCACT